MQVLEELAAKGYQVKEVYLKQQMDLLSVLLILT